MATDERTRDWDQRLHLILMCLVLAIYADDACMLSSHCAGHASLAKPVVFTPQPT